jgi:hypothetical protein
LLSSWLMLPPYCWKRREEGSSGEPKEDGAPSSDHVQYMYHPEASSPWGLLWPLSKSPGLQWGLGFTSGASCSWLGSTVRTNSCVSWQDLAGTGKRQAQNSRIIHSGVILSEPQHLFVCVHFKFWAKQWDGCPLVQRKDQTPSTWRVGVLWPSLAQGKHMLLSNGCFKHAHRCMCSLSLSLSLSVPSHPATYAIPTTSYSSQSFPVILGHPVSAFMKICVGHSCNFDLRKHWLHSLYFSFMENLMASTSEDRSRPLQ